MANKKISELPLGSLTSNSVFPFVEGGVTSRNTLGEINTFITSGISNVGEYVIGWEKERTLGTSITSGKGKGQLFLTSGSSIFTGIGGVDFNNEDNIDSPFFSYEATIVLPDGTFRFLELLDHTGSTIGEISEIYLGNHSTVPIGPIWTGETGAYDYFGYFPSNAIGYWSHAEGVYSTASGDYSHAEGHSNIASGQSAHAEGQNTIAGGDFSHSEGLRAHALGDISHAEGRDTLASGDTSHAEGISTIASGDYSHSQGNGTLASGFASHAEGLATKALADFSHAEGQATSATSQSSHSEGAQTLASGFFSHAQGNFTTSSGIAAHSGGYNSTASGDYSFVHGSGSTALGVHTVVLGSGINGSNNNTVYTPDIVNKRVMGVPSSSGDTLGESGSFTFSGTSFYYRDGATWYRLTGSTSF